IADRVNVRHIRPGEFINDGRAGLVDCNAGRFQTKIVGVRLAADGRKDKVRLDHLTALEGDDESIFLLLDGGDGLTAAHRHAAPLHAGTDRLADIAIEAPQDLLTPVKEGGVDAEPVEDASELDGDIAAADDQE